VGGQATAAENESFSITRLALAAGYSHTWVCKTHEEIQTAIQTIEQNGLQGPHLVEIKICRGSRKDLGRPTRTPVQNKVDFMHFLAINGDS